MDSNPPADQPYPRPWYQPDYVSDQYPGFAPVITQQPASNTTVVVNQQAVVIQNATRNWSSGLCGCFEDCGSCKYIAKVTPKMSFFENLKKFNAIKLKKKKMFLFAVCMGFWCPICLLFDVSSRMGEGCCFPCCHGPGALLGLRIKLRVQQDIQVKMTAITSKKKLK